MHSDQTPQTGEPIAGLRFAEFEIDPTRGELRKHGIRIRIQDQPLRLLLILLERPGELITRDQLREKIWPADTFVEFEHSLNTSVNKLRRALNDSAGRPLYIETVPRHGYRFIGELRHAPPRMQQSVTAAAGEKHGHRGWLWPAALTSLLILGVAGAWYISPRGEQQVAVRLLTSYRGVEGSPHFSPDDSQIAFSWNGPNQDNLDIYVKVAGNGEPLRLTSAPEADDAPAWSPDGRWIAFVRAQATWSEQAEVFIVSPLGGSERKIGETFVRHRFGVPTLSWTADSRWLAIRDDSGSTGPRGLYLLSIDTPERRLLLATPSAVVDHGSAFSRDGRRLIFSRDYALHIVSLKGLTAAGEPRRLTNPGNAADMWPVWTHDEQAVVFARRTSYADSTLWRVAADGFGHETPVPHIGSTASFQPAIARNADRLAYSERANSVSTWRLSLNGYGGASGTPAPILASSRYEGTASLSADGAHIAFTSTRTGVEEIWRARGDGSDAAQLTHYSNAMAGSARWSPDGKHIAYDAILGGISGIFVMNADGGAPRRITEKHENAVLPRWSSDGQWIYFSSNRSGVREVWKRSFHHAGLVQVTRGGAMAGGESPDGRYFCYISEGLWVVPLKDGQPIFSQKRHAAPSASHLKFDISQNGVYFAPILGHPSNPRSQAILFHSFATGRKSTVFAPEMQLVFGLSVSRDERLMLFSQLDDSRGDLVLIEPSRQ